jgi:hypothetical protein
MHLTAYAAGRIVTTVLELVTTEAFAEWFSALDDDLAEEVATALDLVEALGPERAPAGSREALLWYEHASAADFRMADSLAWEFEAWGAFREHAQRILRQLESARFVARLAGLGSDEASRVLKAVRRIRRLADPRKRWTPGLVAARSGVGALEFSEDAGAELRRLHFEVLEAAGFALADVPVHSRALRELARRAPGRAFRLLYGVDCERSRALVVLGERLDRSYYGDSVRRAERLWQAFLDGTLSNVEPLALR